MLWLIFGLLAVAVAVRIQPLAARSERELSTSEMAFLRAGARGALVAAVTGLDIDGAVGQNRPRTKVKRIGAEPPPDADELEQAIYLDVGTPARLRALVRKRRTGAELRAIRDRLRADGLIPRAWQRQIVKAIAVVLIPVAAFARLVTDKVSGWTVAALAVAVLAGLYLLWKPKRTVAGWRLLNALRRETERLLEEWRAEPDYWWEKSPQENVAAQAGRDTAPGGEVPLREGDEPEDGAPEGFFNTPRSRFKRLMGMAMTGSLVVSDGGMPYDSADYETMWDDEGGSSSGGWSMGDFSDIGWDLGGDGGGDGGGGGGGCGGGGCGGGG